jgi:hypothetical protein
MVKTFATFGTYPCFLEGSQSRLQFANLEKFTVFQNQEAISSPVFAKKTLLFYSHMIELVVFALGRRRLPLFCKEACPRTPLTMLVRCGSGGATKKTLLFVQARFVFFEPDVVRAPP